MKKRENFLIFFLVFLFILRNKRFLRLLFLQFVVYLKKILDSVEVIPLQLKELRKYLGIFLVGVALIAVYKTFDSMDRLFSAGKSLFSLLTPFGIGIGIAYILAIPCRKIEILCQKTKLPFFRLHRRGIAIASIYLLFAGAIVLLLFALLPSLVRSISQFLEQLPALVQGAVSWFNSLGIYTIDHRTIQTLINSELLSLDRLLGGFSFDNVNRYARGVLSFGSSLFDIFLGIIISIYLLCDRANLKKAFLRVARAIVPEKQRNICSRYLSKIHEFAILYISCQLVDALIVFVLSFLVLTILQVEYAPLLALLVGSFNLIPYFGAIVATVLAGLITWFTKSFTAALITAAVLVIIQQLDANFIQPKLLSGSLNIRPVWVILGIVLGGGLFGVLGVFLAVPIFALLRIIVLDMLDRREKKKALE